MAKSSITLATVVNLNTAVIYKRILTLGNVGTTVNYCRIIITLAPRSNVMKLFTAVIY
jgi:hypothetical protein